MKHTTLLTLAELVLALTLTACSGQRNVVTSASASGSTVAESVTETQTVPATETTAATEVTASTQLPHIYLRLGEASSRPLYEIELIDNDVSVRFVRILQDSTRVLPLYVFDGSENTDVLQYYDIPSRYDIPDGAPQLVTSEKAGEVYYSAGRIMIFYRDAEITGNYVKIGQTLTTEGLEDAVNSNPLDSWGNRRVTIGIME